MAPWIRAQDASSASSKAQTPPDPSLPPSTLLLSAHEPSCALQAVGNASSQTTAKRSISNASHAHTSLPFHPRTALLTGISATNSSWEDSTSLLSRPTTSSQKKHSHGLSFTSNTRESIFDSLLSSLDDISPTTDTFQESRHESALTPTSLLPSSMSYPAPRTLARNRGRSTSTTPDQTPTSPVRSTPPNYALVPRDTGSSTPPHALHTSRSTRRIIETRPQLTGRTRSGRKSTDTTSSEVSASSPRRTRARNASGDSTSTRKDSDTISFAGQTIKSLRTAPMAAAPEPSIPSGPSTKERNASPSRKLGASSKQSSATKGPLKSVQDQSIGRSPSMRLSPQPDSASPAAKTTSGTSAPDGKRGFLKRVFGHSNSRMNLHSPEHAAFLASGDSPSEPARKVDSPNGGAARELGKKTSAFFRRQKAQIVNAPETPSLPPVHATTNVDADSPARSSLYTVMNPYLAESPTSTPSRAQPRTGSRGNTSALRHDESPSSENTDDPDIFHAGYNRFHEPSRNLSNSSDMRRPSAISAASRDIIAGRNLSVATANSDRAASQTEPLGLAPTVSSVYSTDTGRPDSRDDYLNAQRPISSKGGIQHGIIVETSSPDRRREYTLSTNAQGTAELSEVKLAPSPSLDQDDMVTPRGKTAFTVDDHLFPMADIMKSTAQLKAILDLNNTNDTEESPTKGPSALTPPSQSNQFLNAASPGSDALRNLSVATTGTALTSSTAVMEGAPPDDRERAVSIYDGTEEYIPREQAAAYLGERHATNVNTLNIYMDLFDFKHQSILGGLRMLCSRLVLKAESQQVDRILDRFAMRWCQCNPLHGFQLKDVVHTICYSLLLLNTDMHMAEIESKMTRGQFVKNALPTIKRIVADAQTEAAASEGPTPSSARPGMQWQDSAVTMSANTPVSEEDRRMSTDSRRPTLSKRMSWSFGMGKPEEPPVVQVSIVPNSGSTALVDEKFDGKPAEWHYELEQILKSFFTAIKTEALPLNQGSTVRRTNSLKSMRSMAPSEMSVRSKRADLMSGRWHKNRARSKFYAASTMAASRTSFDDGSSIISPTGSSTWSKFSMGKTLTAPSSESLGMFGPDQSFPQNIGFANALSQTIAREEGIEDDAMSVNPQKFLLEDDSLELAGAPWAKEGIVKHKHHLEGSDKKAKGREWSECFAVIERGYLRLFSFNSKGGKSGSLGVRKSTMHSRKAPSIAPSVVGGGNWMANAEKLGSFLLRQSIASALPPPGYSKARPHVWALSLPNGAVHLFQVGTPEIATEFVNTANYWSARLSKEPLSGGVENTEYGWSDAVMGSATINPSLVAASDAAPPSGHGRNGSISVPRRLSVARSVRGSIDAQGNAGRGIRAGDKAVLEDWKPPAQSMMASALMEVDQLAALSGYISSVEAELERHNELRSNLSSAFSPKSANLTKATSNWEAKSSYLLREIVKFQTYVDALQLASEEKGRIDKERAEREEEKRERERKKREREEAAAAAAAVGAEQQAVAVEA